MDPPPLAPAHGAGRAVKPAALALCVAGALALAAGAAWHLARDRASAGDDLAQRLRARVDWAAARAVPCPEAGAALPLLVLGQSNAGNHGEAGAAPRPPVRLLSPAGCVEAQDPLPGGTGRGGSLWSRLPADLAALGFPHPPLLRVLAVDAASIAEWTQPGSPLRAALQDTLAELRQQGRPPALVLWQQGEADARRGTAPGDYRAGLQRLVDLLQAEGVTAPVLLARSTRCRSEPSDAIRAAVVAQLAADARTRPGPDTDLLAGPDLRHDGCHFSRAGLDAAAALWARAIVAALRAPSPAPAAAATPRPGTLPPAPAR